MPSSTEFILAETALQAEFLRRKIAPPDVEDDLPTVAEGYLAELFSDKPVEKKAMPIRSTYLVKLREETDMAKPVVQNIYIGTTPAQVADDEEDEGEGEEEGIRAVWSTAYVNDLPDSSFAMIESGGKKDDEGKTTPRSLRHLPHHDAEGSIDLPHLRNALARAPQMSTVSEAQRNRAIVHLNTHAKAEGVGQDSTDEKAAVRAVVLSYEQRMKALSAAMRRYGILENSDYYPIATYDDHVVACDWYSGRYYRFDYAWDGSEIALDEPTEVQETFIDLTSAAKSSPLSLFRQRDGKFRWLAISSNTYKDSYKENFSKESLQEAVSAMQKSGDHGELRLEHFPMSTVGACDYSKVLGDFLIESGTFATTARARAAIETLQGDAEGRWRISIGFFYNPAYLVDGEYRSHVRIFERSITQNPANTLTAISLAELGGTMDAEMKTRLAAIVGDDLAEEMMDEAKDNSALFAAIGKKAAEEGFTAMGVKGEDEPVKDKEEELPLELEVEMPDGTVVKAVREGAVQKAETTIKRTELQEMIAAAVSAAVASVKTELLAAVKKEQNSELPRAVRYRVTQQGKAAETEEEEKEAAVVLAAAKGNSPAKFWGQFPGGN